MDVRLEVLADGESKKARDNDKGRLLERLISEFLRHSGYRDVELNVRVDGAEWDVQGQAALSGSTVLVSCKCLSVSVSCDPLRSLAFEVVNRSYQEPTICGVMVAVPKLSEDAKAYWDSVNPAAKRVRIVEERDLIAELCRQPLWQHPEAIRALVSERHSARPADLRLIHCHAGSLWVQFVRDDPSALPLGYYLLHPDGQEVSSASLITEIERLAELNGSDLKDARCLNSVVTQDSVRGSGDLPTAHLTVSGSGWFDYKYPAPPECCAGRQAAIAEFLTFLSQVQEGRTASRVCIVTGPSGIGKSSFILKLEEQAAAKGGHLVSINCIPAKGKTFVLAAALRLLRSLQFRGDLAGLSAVSIDGLASLPTTLNDLSRRLATSGVTPVLFFDQFEHALLDGPLADAMVELVLSLEELRAPMIIGFAWKTDLWWPDDHVPYTARENLRRTAFHIQIDQFGPGETNQLLQALAREIGQPLAGELAKEVREFSRGFPWLLKKVCWHIREQVRRGLTQQEILERKLDLRPLFEADLELLDETERDTLQKLAAVLPTDSRTIVEAFGDQPIADMLNKFVNLRLVVRQGESYAIYHDIFKEFLRTGRVPIEQSYLFHVSPRKSLEIVQVLADVGDELELENLARVMRMNTRTLNNYVGDLCSLGLVSRRRGRVSLHRDVAQIETEEDLIREARRRVVRNTCAAEIIKLVKEGQQLSIQDVAALLKREFPSVPAKEETWKNYARWMIRWLNQVNATPRRITLVGEATSQRRLVGSETTAQYPAGFVNSTVRFVDALAKHTSLKKGDLVRILGRSPKTIEKALVDGRLLGLCERLVDGSWRLTSVGQVFAAAGPMERRRLFRDAMLKVPFVREFAHEQASSPERPPMETVGLILRRQGKRVSVETVRTLARILANWSTYADVV